MSLWTAPDLGAERPLSVHYGGGTDSTAMLIEMARRGIVPDLVLFANTFGEKPWTYVFVNLFSQWLVDHGMPAVTWVNRLPSRPSKTGPGYSTLEANCLQNRTLPSLAFGRKACSLKWKVEPMDRFYKNWPVAQAAWARGVKPMKLLGYDSSPADSRRAVGRTEDTLFRYRYPLREWGWTREMCIGVIAAAGLPQPGKSACFFCPASKPWELVDLAQRFPDMWMRAVMMEDRAAPWLGPTVKGLWRKMSWREFGLAHGLPLPPLPQPSELVRPWIEEEEPVSQDLEDEACYQEEAPI